MSLPVTVKIYCLIVVPFSIYLRASGNTCPENPQFKPDKTQNVITSKKIAGLGFLKLKNLGF